MIKPAYFSENLALDVKKIILEYQELAAIRCEADFYGASRIIASTLRVDVPPISYSSWSHGCHDGIGLNKQVILWNEKWSLNKLVANPRIAKFLTEEGVARVYATGLPFIYVSKQVTEKTKNSILLMPAHSLSYVKIKQDIESLIEAASAFKKDGFYVCFCVHKDCVKHGEITAILDKNGVDWFAGAAANDPNSLQRMRNIFDYFEYVGSNTIGSHFFYSQLCGAKFYFTEPYFEYKSEMFLKDPFFSKNKKLLEDVISESFKKNIERNYPDYFLGFENAKYDLDLAGDVCGIKSKRTPSELATLLGWNFKDQIYGSVRNFADRAYRKVKTYKTSRIM